MNIDLSIWTIPTKTEPPKRAGYVQITVHVDGLSVYDTLDITDKKKARQTLHDLTDRVHAMMRARES